MDKKLVFSYTVSARGCKFSALFVKDNIYVNRLTANDLLFILGINDFGGLVYNKVIFCVRGVFFSVSVPSQVLI